MGPPSLPALLALDFLNFVVNRTNIWALLSQDNELAVALPSGVKLAPDLITLNYYPSLSLSVSGLQRNYCLFGFNALVKYTFAKTSTESYPGASQRWSSSTFITTMTTATETTATTATTTATTTTATTTSTRVRDSQRTSDNQKSWSKESPDRKSKLVSISADIYFHFRYFTIQRWNLLFGWIEKKLKCDRLWINAHSSSLMSVLLEIKLNETSPFFSPSLSLECWVWSSLELFLYLGKIWHQAWVRA